jgi:hypothetical protein
MEPTPNMTVDADGTILQGKTIQSGARSDSPGPRPGKISIEPVAPSAGSHLNRTHFPPWHFQPSAWVVWLAPDCTIPRKIAGDL